MAAGSAAAPGVAGRLVIVCGLPGAGKTTLARRLERELPAVRLSADDWLLAVGNDVFDEPLRARVEALQWELARRLLSQGQTVVVEWGSWSRAERDALRTGAREVGAAVELHVLDAPDDVLWERIQARDADGTQGGRALTRRDLTKYRARFERPDAAELAGYDPPPA